MLCQQFCDWSAGNPLPLYPTKCVHIPVLAKGWIALIIINYYK